MTNIASLNQTQIQDLSLEMSRRWDDAARMLNEYITNALENRDYTRPKSPEWEGYNRESETAQIRLRDARHAWEAYRNHPTVIQMAEVVREYMTHYQTDFYAHDIPRMASDPARPFIWAVRPTGTWLLWAQDDNPSEAQTLLDYSRKEGNHIYFVGSLETGLRPVPDPENLVITPLP